MPESVPDKLVLVVVGAHIRAELYDRAVADRLCVALGTAIGEKWSSASEAESPAPRVTVLTDLWRLNDPMLAPLPQVSIGHPDVNALSAFLADKVPPAFVLDGELAVQFDAAAPEAVALCWGTSHQSTARAADEFLTRYLDSFVDAAVRELAE